MTASTKVLHIVESLDDGAVENWLLRMLRHARARGVDVDWTFYCTLGREGRLDCEARALGSPVVHSPFGIGDTLAFGRSLRATLRQGGYDVVHSHHDIISPIYWVAALGLPIGKRLVHAHNADEAVLTPSRIKRVVLRPILRRMNLALTDGRIGNSIHTLDTLLGGRESRDGRDVVLYYGVDAAPFKSQISTRATFRRELGLPQDCRILLFAGRMVPEKNPLFAVDVLAELRDLDPSVAGVFVGRGSLDDAVRARAAQRGLADAFRHLGWRNDVPAVMRACDWFILPHPEQPMEGFGLAVLEAQLAGLRLLLSPGIADDPLLPTARFVRLPLAAGSKAWAAAASQMFAAAAPTADAALSALRDSPMDMDRALDALLGLYS